MTREEEAYVTMLNTLGSDIEPPNIQAMVDGLHAKADPEFAAKMALRAAVDQAKSLKWVTTFNQGCHYFGSEDERTLYDMGAKAWNMLQALIKVAENASK